MIHYGLLRNDVAIVSTKPIADGLEDGDLYINPEDNKTYTVVISDSMLDFDRKRIEYRM